MSDPKAIIEKGGRAPAASPRPPATQPLPPAPDDLPPTVGDGLLEHVAHAVSMAKQRPHTEVPRVPIPGVEQARRDARRRQLTEAWAAQVPPEFIGAKVSVLGRCRAHADGAGPDCTDCADAAAAKAGVERWVAEYAADALNLVVAGPTGSGKTFLGFAAARHAFADGRALRFRPSVELLGELDWRADGARAALEAACSAPVLFVDDLGIERSSDWAQEQWYTIVNRRWMDRLPTIVTTNLDPETTDLRDHLGAGGRTYDRLRDRAVGIWLGGESRRGNHG